MASGFSCDLSYTFPHQCCGLIVFQGNCHPETKLKELRPLFSLQSDGLLKPLPYIYKVTILRYFVRTIKGSRLTLFPAWESIALGFMTVLLAFCLVFCLRPSLVINLLFMMVSGCERHHLEMGSPQERKTELTASSHPVTETSIDLLQMKLLYGIWGTFSQCLNRLDP